MNTVNINTFDTRTESYKKLSHDEQMKLLKQKEELFQDYYITLADDLDTIFGNRKKIKIPNVLGSWETNSDTYTIHWNISKRTVNTIFKNLQNSFYGKKKFENILRYSLKDLKKSLKKQYNFLKNLHRVNPKYLERSERRNLEEIKKYQEIIKQDKTAL